MLHIFADALLIAARMEPSYDAESRRRPEPEAEIRTRRHWFALSGLRR